MPLSIQTNASDCASFQTFTAHMAAIASALDSANLAQRSNPAIVPGVGMNVARIARHFLDSLVDVAIRIATGSMDARNVPTDEPERGAH